MPLHAAGDYAKEGAEHRAYNYAISSYIPTLTSLLHSSDKTDTDSGGILAISEPSTLPGTVREVEAMRQRVGNMAFDWLNAEQGSKDAVLTGMAKHSFVHLACHAVQDTVDPLKSAFKLHEDTLALGEIMQKSFQNGRLAFLSACQTATGDEALPDESIHLAAGMLFAGYPTVIAAMWSIQDEDAPLVARQFYDRLINADTGIADATHAALALHEATATLRDEVGEINFARWVPFIHMGL
jgi:CHAT domain-containing protein